MIQTSFEMAALLFPHGMNRSYPQFFRLLFSREGCSVPADKTQLVKLKFSSREGMFRNLGLAVVAFFPARGYSG